MTNNKTKIPNIFSGIEEFNQVFPSKKTPISINESRIKRRLYDELLNTLPYFKSSIKDDDMISWMDSTYIHPLNFITRSVGNLDYEKSKKAMCLFNCSAGYKFGKYFGGHKISPCPFVIEPGKEIEFKQVCIPTFGNPLSFQIQDNIFDDYTQKFLQYRLQNNEFSSRLYGGYVHSKLKFLDINISDKEINYLYDNFGIFDRNYDSMLSVAGKPIILNSLISTTFTPILPEYRKVEEPMVDTTDRYFEILQKTRYFVDENTFNDILFTYQYKIADFDNKFPPPPNNAVLVVPKVNSIVNNVNIGGNAFNPGHNHVVIDLDYFLEYDDYFNQNALLLNKKKELYDLMVFLENFKNLVDGRKIQNPIAITFDANYLYLLDPSSVDDLISILKLFYLSLHGKDCLKTFFDLSMISVMETNENKLFLFSQFAVQQAPPAGGAAGAQPVVNYDKRRMFYAHMFPKRILTYDSATDTYDIKNAHQDIVSAQGARMDRSNSPHHNTQNVELISLCPLSELRRFPVEAIDMATVYHCSFKSIYPVYKGYKEEIRVQDMDIKCKELDMFWTGISMKEWNNLQTYDKAIIGNLCMVLGLYDMRINLDSVKMHEITYCGILNQIPNHIEVKRVCFLPYTIGDSTLYSILKTVSTEINNQDIKKPVAIDPKTIKTLELNPVQHYNFISSLDTITEPYQVLAQYSYIKFKDSDKMDKTIDPRTTYVVLKNNKVIMHIIWVLLSKLGYIVRTYKINDDDMKFSVTPVFNKLSLLNKIKANMRKIDKPLELAEKLVASSSGLINFISNFMSYKTVNMACRDISAGNKIYQHSSLIDPSQIDTNATDCLLSFSNDSPEYHKIDFKSLNDVSNEMELLNIDPFKNSYKDFKDVVNKIPFKSSIEMAKDLIPHLPEVVKAKYGISTMAYKELFEPKKLSTIPISIAGSYNIAKANNLTYNFSKDESAGYTLESLFEDANNSGLTDADNALLVESLAKQLMNARNSVQSSYMRPLNIHQKLQESEASARQVLQKGDEISRVTHNLILKLKMIERIHGIEFDVETKEFIAKQSKDAMNMMMNMYKMAVIVDFIKGMFDFLGKGGKVTNTGLEDQTITRDILSTVFGYLKPSLNRTIGAYSLMATKVMDKVKTEFGIDIDENQDEEFFRN